MVTQPLFSGGAGLTAFRLYSGQVVIDFPLPLAAGVHPWIATAWPDQRSPDGWNRLLWEKGPQQRGFTPVVLELGDVVEFGVHHSPQHSTHWYGYLHEVRADAVVLHGPHPTLADTYTAAQHALLHHLHTTPTPPLPTHRGRGLEPGDGRPATFTPAQRPSTLRMVHHGAQTTIGDPLHGWLVVDTDALIAAMATPHQHLVTLLNGYARLDGREPPLTLAALAAHHRPDQLTVPLTSPPQAGVPLAPPPQPGVAPAATHGHPAAAGPHPGAPARPPSTTPPPEASI